MKARAGRLARLRLGIRQRLADELKIDPLKHLDWSVQRHLVRWILGHALAS